MLSAVLYAWLRTPLQESKFEDDPWSETLFLVASFSHFNEKHYSAPDDTQTFRMYMSLPSLTTMKRGLSLKPVDLKLEAASESKETLLNAVCWVPPEFLI